MSLDAPLPGETAPSMTEARSMDTEAEGAAFMAAMHNLTGG